MAKQLGVIQYSGKLGQTVGRKKAKGQKNNGMAAYQTNVTNPKTIAQRMQRVRLLPANNFYRALVELLDHSWQGVPYIGPSHNEFMKNALRMKSGFPYLVQGDTRPVPGNYLISKGGLAPITFSNDAITLGDGEDFTGASVDNAPTLAVSLNGNALTSDSTIGDLSQYFISSYPTLRDGDQVTFIFALIDGDSITEDPVFYYRYARFVIDTGSMEPLTTWRESEKITIQNDMSTFMLLNATGHQPVGAGIIVSRPPMRRGGAWQRSTSYFLVTTALLQQFMSPAAQQAALDSLDVKLTEQTSDWYLNQGSTSSTSQGGGSLAERSLATANITINGQQKSRLVMIQGNKTYLVAGPIDGSNRYLYEYDATSNTAHYSTNTRETVANVAATGMEIRTISTVQNYFPQLTVSEGAGDDNP